jgi:hypothetical protein
MNIVSNEKLIRRNTRIAQITMLAGLLVLFGGVYLFISQPENFPLIWATVLIGFILSQIGTYFSNRWGRRPRLDEHLNAGLKGLESTYSLYHYVTPVSHLLVGPAGVWVLLARYQKGRITFEKGRWRQRGGGFFQAYMKIFGQEGLGRPDLEIEAELDTARKYFKKKFPDQELPPLSAALVFTSSAAEVEADNAPTLTTTTRRLKEAIRKAAKTRPITLERVKEIQRAIEAGAPPVEETESNKEKSKEKSPVVRRKK